MVKDDLSYELYKELEHIFTKDRVKANELYREIYGRDGSYFNIIPKVVVRPESVEEVIALIKLLPKYNEHVTFRAGGTSLSGQSVGSGIICDLKNAWKKMRVLEKGAKVWFEPGLTCAQVNKELAKYGCKMGADPASHQAAMIGGILANNSSGMEAGTKFNSYHMLSAIEFVMANGNAYNSSNPKDADRFEANERALCAGLMEIYNEIHTNTQIKNRIIEKYKIKNVTGYGMNAFVDFDNPFDIFCHLLIGSEGTLAFISSAEQNTVPLKNFYTSSLIYFNNASLAAASVPSLVETNALSIEMMDYASLLSLGANSAISNLKSMPKGATAMLVDYGADSMEELNALTQSYMPNFQKLNGVESITPFTTTVEQRAKLWEIRDGIFPCVAGARVLGDSVILEDVVAPPVKLYNLVEGIQGLFAKYNYNGALFGHARDGNLHPLVTTKIVGDDNTKQFGDFMGEFVDLVLSLNGSLKGEHGTGRAVAPFVEKEWGEQIYNMMKQIKKLADPKNIFNPDIIISDNKEVFLENIKDMTPFAGDYGVHVHDKCIECGFCEHVCPSRNITLTPRQRIQARRIIKFNTVSEYKNKLEKEYKYDGVETCASDGMCKTLCPMQINTADLTDKLRALQLDSAQKEILTSSAKHFEATESATKDALSLAVDMEHVVSAKPFEWMLDVGHFFSRGVPHWSRNFPASPKFEAYDIEEPDLIYFPSCVTRIFGSSNVGKDNLMKVVLRVAQKAGVRMKLFQNAQGLCCSQIWQHKGDIEGAKIMANKVVEKFYDWSNGGQIPIMCDTTSCTHTLISTIIPQEGISLLSVDNEFKYKQLKFTSMSDWLLHVVLKRRKPKVKKGSVLLHPTCSCEQMGLTSTMEEIAKICADEVVIPSFWGCCGASGDRGFMFPELGKSALQEELEEIRSRKFDGYYSSARTCEINLKDHTDANFESIVYLVDEVLSFT